jgi:hypothetical protein
MRDGWERISPDTRVPVVVFISHTLVNVNMSILAKLAPAAVQKPEM